MRPVILIRRSLSGPGGAERVFHKYKAALQADCQVIPVCEPPALRGNSARRALAFTRLADEVIAEHPEALSISLERGPSAQIYRAGDGVHRHYRRLLGGISFNPIHRVYPRLDEKSFRAARVIIANSQMVADEIRHTYPWAAAKVRVVVNGIDLQKFCPPTRPMADIRAQLDLPAQGPLFLFMANGWQRKGLRQTLQILKACASVSPRLVIVGKGNPADLKGLDAIYRGVVDNMADYYQACNAFLLPTLYDPFTSSVLEALACGLPVVTTAHNGASQVIQHGLTGYVLPHQNKQLKEAADWLMQNLSTDRRLISQTVQAYSVQREIAAIRNIFAELKAT